MNIHPILSPEFPSEWGKCGNFTAATIRTI